jgi:type II secretory pathway predicted ATPase ExeA
MYETRFALLRRPFRSSPDGDAYFPAAGHENAFSVLMQALEQGEGLMLLTGEPGAGKTLLCHRLLEALGTEVSNAFLTTTHFRDASALLQAVLHDFGHSFAGLSEQELRLAVTDYLLRCFAEGRPAVLLVDEAQNLGRSALEELRLLGNLEAQGAKAIQVVLAGQPRILKNLARPELASLSQRLSVRVHLPPITREEGIAYLLHQLQQAGGQPNAIINLEAQDLLAKASRGVPRLLNQAAHRAFTLAHVADAPSVDLEAALEAIRALGLDAHHAAGGGPSSSTNGMKEKPPVDPGQAVGPGTQKQTSPAHVSQGRAPKGARRLFAVSSTRK